jgi:hypothetical protein
MDEPLDMQLNEPLDGDWYLVDLSDPITEEATKMAHALGMNFYDFMCQALEEKLAGLRGDEKLREAVEKVEWVPLLKDLPERIASLATKGIPTREDPAAD